MEGLLAEIGNEAEASELLKEGDMMCRSYFSAYGCLNKDVTSKLEKRLGLKMVSAEDSSASTSGTEALEMDTSLLGQRKRPVASSRTTPTPAKRFRHIDSSRRSPYHHYTQSSPGVMVNFLHRSLKYKIQILVEVFRFCLK